MYIILFIIPKIYIYKHQNNSLIFVINNSNKINKTMIYTIFRTKTKKKNRRKDFNKYNYYLQFLCWSYFTNITIHISIICKIINLKILFSVFIIIFNYFLFWLLIALRFIDFIFYLYFSLSLKSKVCHWFRFLNP